MAAISRPKKTAAILITAILAIALTGTAVLAWFADSLTTYPNITSHVHKSYFESGDGTSAAQFIDGTHGDDDSGCAFEIKYPVQLYYFAWLQALGYFNMPNDGGNTINQVYFYLSDDLDMTGYVLPQIGTQEYPFVGNFNGNGHTITNLTVQNVETSGGQTWTDKPDETVSDSYAQIVGFFGVIGSLNSVGTVNGAVESGGSFTATAGYTYSSQINEIKNFALSDVTVKTQTTSSLIGIVAGYVNGTVSNVQVSDSGAVVKNGSTAALTLITPNLSDYTLLGYVTDPYKDQSDVVFAKVGKPTENNSHFNYTAQGAAAGWGGSIDMLDMFNRLKNVRATTTSGSYWNQTTTYTYLQQITRNNHTATEIRRYAADGTLIGTPATSFGVPSEDEYYMYTSANDGSGQYVLSFNYSDNESFNYLASTYKSVTEIHETNDTVSAFYIQHNGTYLNLNNAGTGVTNATPTGGNTKWVIDASNHIYTQDNDGVKYYLNATNNNALAIGDTGTTAWNKSADAIRSGNNGPYLQYDNGWRLIADGETAYYHISYTTGGTTYYLNENNGAISRGTTATTKWYRSGTGTGTLSTISANSNTYYLYTSGRNGNLSLQTNNQTTWTFNSDGRISYSNYYIGIYDNAWTCRRNYLTAYGTIAQGGTDINAHTELTFTDTTIPVINRIEKTEPAEFTYIPLSASQNSPFTVNSQNTGYIIGGSYDTTNRKSDIRISQYGKTNISAGLTSANANGQVNNSTVKTVINGTIQNVNTNNLVRYASAVKQFNAVLSGTTNVYGLHFMNAEISKDHLIIAPKVMLEGSTYENYEMPEDSIDFWVHQKGYITFFAGTYFTDNNSFFSLHIIERDPDDNTKITAIKEIKEIWKSSDQSKDYIYYLKKDDGSYEWSETKTSDYSLAFNTDWITQPGTTAQLGNDSLYYFEIPVNAGEFALGSVAGRTGAYLLYLDIAANAQLVDRAAVIENFEEVTNTYEYPVGATFQNTAISASSTDPVIPSALAALPVNASGNNVTVTDDTHITFSSGTVTYIKDGVTVNGNLTAADIAAAPIATTTKRIRRTTYYDYNVAKNRYTVTVVEVTQIDGGAISVTINAWNTGSDWDTEGADAEQIAAMTAGFTPTVGGATTGVAINAGASQTLDYVEVDEVYCYLINVGTGDDAQALRLDRDAFEGTLALGTELYQFSYAIKDNDDATDGATIDYDYSCDIAFDQNAADDAGLYTFSNRSYTVTVTSTQTIKTKVVTAVTDNNYSVTLTPTPS